jgi:hypothetical protein
MDDRIGKTPARSRSRSLGEGDTKGYRWPADKLTVADMHMLHLISVRTKKPINVLLHEAVQSYYEVMRNEE